MPIYHLLYHAAVTVIIIMNSESDVPEIVSISCSTCGTSHDSLTLTTTTHMSQLLYKPNHIKQNNVFNHMIVNARILKLVFTLRDVGHLGFICVSK